MPLLSLGGTLPTSLTATPSSTDAARQKQKNWRQKRLPEGDDTLKTGGPNWLGECGDWSRRSRRNLESRAARVSRGYMADRGRRCVSHTEAKKYLVPAGGSMAVGVSAG